MVIETLAPIDITEEEFLEFEKAFDAFIEPYKDKFPFFFIIPAGEKGRMVSNMVEDDVVTILFQAIKMLRKIEKPDTIQ